MAKKAQQKARTRKDERLDFLETVAFNNGAAIKQGPKRKTFTVHDLRTIKPLTETQRQMFEAFMSGYHVVANGSAGTGKSFLSVYLALNEVLEKSTPQNKILIVRSAVPTREIGHLPGSIEEKLAIYEEPYVDIFHSLLGKADAYQTMKEAGMVKFMSTSFVRGLTWDDAVVIVDEAQNMTLQEIHSVMTRVGENTKVIVCGDIAQNDLITKRNDISGFLQAIEIMSRMKDFDDIVFTEKDIVRSSFVRDWIIAKQAA